MSVRRSLRTTVLAPLAAVPLLFALGAPAGAGTSDPLPPMSPSTMPVFSNPTDIDNRFFPLVPGTEWVYKGTVTEAGEQTPHRVVFTVSRLTKKIDDVETVVGWDRDFADGDLEESELAFFAQDDEGTVWRFGEYPETFEDGTFAGAPDTWVTGLAGARGGIYMLDDPEVGDSYVQGLVRSIEFFDVAEVASLDQRTCVPQCYDDVLVIHETSPLDEEGGTQTKFYAPGTGLVRIGAIGGDSQERMALRSVKQLRGDALDAIDEEVRALDGRGYENSSVYSRTEPVK